MICDNCKNEVNDGLEYCPRCKSKIENTLRRTIETTGVTHSNVGSANIACGEVKFHANRGHGFAAERANHLYDMLYGKNVKLVGDENKLNGADRIVNGDWLQSKYCSTGAKCIKDCFRKNDVGQNVFRYIREDGTPMQIEVPADKYHDAVIAMEHRIRNKQVPGITDPQKAKEIVRKGHFTYEQARNIAKAGTVESLQYDAVNGVIISLWSSSITFVITFAISVRNGKDTKEALKLAMETGFKVGGVAFFTAVLSGQLTKSGIQGALSGVTKELVQMIGPKGSAILVNALRSGPNIYGAAALSSAQKMVGTNLVTGTISVVVLSSVDVANIFRGRISGKQFVKNLVNTTSSVAGGFIVGTTAGAVVGAKVGAAIGTIVFPGGGTVTGATIGTAVGATASVIGTAVGGFIAGKTSYWITDKFIEDDAVKMLNIIENKFKEFAFNYILNQEEAEKTIDLVAKKITSSMLKDMFKEKNKDNFAKSIIEPCVEEIIKTRSYVKLPTQKHIIDTLEEFIDVSQDIYDNMLEKQKMDWLREGMRHYNSQRYKLALDCFKKSVKEGNLEALYRIGWCYHKGRGVKVSIARARVYYRKAAERGHFLAQKRLDELKPYSVGNVKIFNKESNVLKGFIKAYNRV